MHSYDRLIPTCHNRSLPLVGVKSDGKSTKILWPLIGSWTVYSCKLWLQQKKRLYTVSHFQISLIFVSTLGTCLFKGQESNLFYRWASNIGKCDIHAERKILFMNKMKRHKIWYKLKGLVLVLKSFYNLLTRFVKGLNKSWLGFCPFCMNKS